MIDVEKQEAKYAQGGASLPSAHTHIFIMFFSLKCVSAEKNKPHPTQKIIIILNISSTHAWSGYNGRPHQPKAVNLLLYAMLSRLIVIIIDIQHRCLKVCKRPSIVTRIIQFLTFVVRRCLSHHRPATRRRAGWLAKLEHELNIEHEH